MPGVPPSDSGGNRRILLAVGVFVAAGMAGLAALRRWLDALRFKPADEAAQSLRLALQLLQGALVLGLGAFGVYAFRLGTRTKAAERFPPPGTAALAGTRVVEGRAARTQGTVLQAVGVLFLVFAVVTGLLVYRLFALLPG
ncbi:MAG: hypothetical protein R2745_22120 [Vicinamibacterales bacterium]